MLEAPKKLAVVLLAGGVSKRFGSNKLVAEVQGMPLVSTAIRLLESQMPVQKIAIVSSIYHGELQTYFDPSWQVAIQSDSDSQPWDSLQLAKALLNQKDVSSVLVHLADMPHVSETYLQKMACSQKSLVSRIAGQTTPPFVLVGKDRQWLDDSRKDFRNALAGLKHIEAEPGLFRDIDTKEDVVGLDGTSGRT